VGFSDNITDNGFTPDPANQRLLRDALGRFSTGVTVVTAITDSGPAAITVNSFSSVSLTPALVLWSIERSASRHRCFTKADNYSIHVLAWDQESLCMNVARDPNYFKQSDYRLNRFGVPVFDCLARFDCTQDTVYQAGDHDVILGRVQMAMTAGEEAPLLFYRGQTGTIISTIEASKVQTNPCVP